MSARNFFTLAIFILLAVPVAAQQLEYLVNYREKVHADYNILSASKNATYKTYDNVFFAHLDVSFVNDRLFELRISDTDSSYHAHDEGYNIMVKLNGEKQIDSLFFENPPTRDQEVKSKLILSQIQYFRFRDMPFKRKTREEFIDGKFAASYTIEKSNGPENNLGSLRIKKTISTEERETGMMQKIILDAYQATYTIDRHKAMVTSLHITEKKHQKIQNKIIAFIRSQFDMKVVGTSSDGSKRPSNPRENERSYGSRIFSQPDIFLRNKLISEKLIQSDNLDSLKKKLLVTANLSLEERVQLSARFRAWIFLHPADIGAVKNLLGLYTIKDDEYNLLIDAIVNTSLPEVQDIFTQIIEQNRNNEPVLRILLPKAAGVALPTAKLLRVLLALKIHAANSDISSLSGLSLSNLLHLPGNNHAGLNDSITIVLQRYYKENRTNRDETIQYLLEAGNSGNDIYVHDIAKFIASGDQEVRAESLYALRFMHSGKVDSLLSAALGTSRDSAEAAEVYAVMKIRFPTASLRQAVLSYIGSNKQKNEQLCILFLEYLNGYIDEVSAIRAELLSLAAGPTIHKIAREMVDKYERDFAIFNK